MGAAGLGSSAMVQVWDCAPGCRTSLKWLALPARVKQHWEWDDGIEEVPTE